MTIYAEITVDLYQRLPLSIITAKQGDTGRGAIVTVTAGDTVPDFTGASVNIYIKKPDGTKIYNACTVADNVITVDFTNQALAVPGDAEAELQAILGDDILSTPIFTLRVLPSNIDDTAIESSDEFTALEDALIAVAGIHSSIMPVDGEQLPLVTDLATYQAAQTNNVLYFVRADTTTTDKPTGANNVSVISYKYNNYGMQLAISSAGLQLRTKVNGVWSAWASPGGGGGGSVDSVNGYTGTVVLDADDVGAAPAVTEVTVATAGAVTQALDAGKIYHFTGNLTALTITLNAPDSGLAWYHFDFESGSGITLTLPNTVKMPDSFAVEAGKVYEIDVLGNRGAVLSWSN